MSKITLRPDCECKSTTNFRYLQTIPQKSFQKSSDTAILMLLFGRNHSQAQFSSLHPSLPLSAPLLPRCTSKSHKTASEINPTNSEVVFSISEVEKITSEVNRTTSEVNQIISEMDTSPSLFQHQIQKAALPYSIHFSLARVRVLRAYIHYNPRFLPSLPSPSTEKHLTTA